LVGDDRPAAVASEEIGLGETPAPPTAAQIEQWQEEGREAGFRRGLEEGRQASLAEVQAKAARLEGIIHCLAQPLQDLDEQAEQELVQLVVSMAQQLVRRELHTDPGEIVGVIRQSLALLPSAARHVRVHLHTEDAALVREALAIDGAMDEATDEEKRNWRIIEDPLITRGGCEIKSETSRIDATLEKRLASLSATMLGGLREGD
jgi:flagellar assembly protein FliH